MTRERQNTMKRCTISSIRKITNGKDTSIKLAKRIFMCTS
jgi:hypothetical protein